MSLAIPSRFRFNISPHCQHSLARLPCGGPQKSPKALDEADALREHVDGEWGLPLSRTASGLMTPIATQRGRRAFACVHDVDDRSRGGSCAC
jgi:hypothetical protein